MRGMVDSSTVVELKPVGYSLLSSRYKAAYSCKPTNASETHSAILVSVMDKKIAEQPEAGITKESPNFWHQASLKSFFISIMRQSTPARYLNILMFAIGNNMVLRLTFLLELTIDKFYYTTVDDDMLII